MLACRCFAQEAAPVGIIRGDLLAWSGDAKGGELVFRNLENRVFQCSFDERTYFERSSERITVAGTSRGDHVELGVIDAQPASMDAKNESETIETMSLRMDESS